MTIGLFSGGLLCAAKCATRARSLMLFCVSDPSLGGQLANLADIGGDAVRRWVNASPSPTLASSPPAKSHLNNNTIDLVAPGLWGRPKDDMPMLLQQPPSQLLLGTHEADQPLDFTMSKFKAAKAPSVNTAATVASQLKHLNSLATQQQKMLLQHANGAAQTYYASRNNNKSFTRGSSPSSSSEEEGVGPPLPASSPDSPAPLRGDGKSLSTHLFIYGISKTKRFYIFLNIHP